MKKVILFVIVLVVLIFSVFYFFSYKKIDKELVYQEPTSIFFDGNLLSSKDIIVKITDDGFVPKNINIKKGDKISFVNETSGSYVWPASDPHPTHTNFSSFDAQLPMKKGEAWSFVFETVGTFKYHDHLDPIKRGIVFVSPQ